MLDGAAVAGSGPTLLMTSGVAIFWLAVKEAKGGETVIFFVEPN